MLQDAAAQAPTTTDLFRALLAAKHLLAGGKPDADPIDESYLAKVMATPGSRRCSACWRCKCCGRIIPPWRRPIWRSC